MKRQLISTMLIAASIFGVGVASGKAQAEPTMKRYPAVVKCGGEVLAEDSAAHVKLVRFARAADGTTVVVYKCLKAGY